MVRVRWSLCALVSAAALLFSAVFPAPARADIKPEDLEEREKERKEEREKAPDAQGFGEGVAPPALKNPLPEIVELMRAVEQRLAEAETDRWTQEEQQKIVKALEGQQSSVERLKKLIKEVEESAQQGGGGGDGGRSQRQGGQSRREQERLREREQDGERRPVNPQAREQEREGENNRQRDERQRAREERRSRELPPDAGGPVSERRADAGEQWGNLPPKAMREVIDARRRPMPARFRKQLEEYYRKLLEAEGR